ncbi:glycosyltransferase family 39 protein [Sphingomonas aerophila]|uniref:4-amino-4-deoxy-L-arabinose transferase-like glycosyltransferase n=1 Tax=Sphingomonas aerophila TaxID=1344948 RepID=A0A7W9BB64_9SPHN|nr:glycosyltransferase family 39 protein [Sphingomonas aerophila]MBB5713982.1 4-amino-4-deoxy-L-arabinose transferase-like glycosyltransferase [Sphingomonas aerophila]
MAALRPLSRQIANTILLGLVTLAITAATQGLSPSLIEPDEGGHYVNALFLGDWIRAGFPSPMAWARDYYAHFPRLSIGHWPPAWYMVEAPFFALFRPTPYTAAIISALLAGLPGVAVLWAGERIGKRGWGLLLAITYALLPVTLEGARYILLDQPLALVVALAVIAWQRAAEKGGWARFITFALLAAACPLVKGNGALIALVPPIHIALTGRSNLLRRPELWAAAGVTLALVAPWYWLSFKISAEGFNYAPGLAYAGLALIENARTILANVGLAGVALAGVGAASLFRPRSEPERDTARLSLAVILATLIFQSAVPASLVGRYLSPLLPWLVILAGLGLLRIARWRPAGSAAAAVIGGLALLPGLQAVAALNPKPEIGAPALAEAITAKGGLYLVDGRSGGEGALIAAAAHADNGRRRVWIARASQWLSQSDFMGRGYRLTVSNPAETRAVLDRLGAAGAVSIAVNGHLAYPHSRLLLEAIGVPSFEGIRQPFRLGSGKVILARRRTWVMPNVSLLASDPISAKAGKMARALE